MIESDPLLNRHEMSGTSDTQQILAAITMLRPHGQGVPLCWELLTTVSSYVLS